MSITADELLFAYRAESTKGDSEDVQDEKTKIIAQLDDYLSEPAVFEFLIAVLRQPSEYDLCKIEVLRLLEIADLGKSQQETAARTILQVLKDETDDNILNFAAIAAANFMQEKELSQEILNILTSPEKNDTLRWNAFAAVKRSGASAKNIAALIEVQTDKDFGESAVRVLSEWKAI